MLMTEFLSKNTQNEVIGNYLELLAFSAQKTESLYALMQLQRENTELKNENNLLKEALQKHLEELLDFEQVIISEPLQAKLQQFLIGKAKDKSKSFIKDIVTNISSYTVSIGTPYRNR